MSGSEHQSRGRTGARGGGGQGGAGNTPVFASPVVRAAYEFVLGRRENATEPVVVGLHHGLGNAIWARWVLAAHRADAKLAAGLDPGRRSLVQLIKDPAFDWGPVAGEIPWLRPDAEVREFNFFNLGVVREFVERTRAPRAATGELDLGWVKEWQRARGLTADGRIELNTLVAARREHAVGEAPSRKAAQEAAAPAARAKHAPDAASVDAALAEVKDEVTTTTVRQFHPEEIFADNHKNVVSGGSKFNKRHMYSRLKSSWHALEKARSGGRAKQIAAAEKHYEEAVAVIVEFDLHEKAAHDLKIKDKQRQLARAKADCDHAAEALLKREIATLFEQLRDTIRHRHHAEAASATISMFEPVATQVDYHRVTFPDGVETSFHDHSDNPYTVYPKGFDNDHAPGSANRIKEVQERVDASRLNASDKLILKTISGFEGTFDTINSYDRARVTFGFVQWTGGHESDLTKALHGFKSRRPEVFAEQFQRYGIDIVGNKLMVMKDGKVYSGDEAAQAILADPKRMAVFAHAGHNPEIQIAEIEEAFRGKIAPIFTQHYRVSTGGEMSANLPGSTLITTLALAALLANREVHAGGARGALQHHLDEYTEKHPYEKHQERFNEAKWLEEAEEAAITKFAASDGERGLKLAQLPGKYR